MMKKGNENWQFITNNARIKLTFVGFPNLTVLDTQLTEAAIAEVKKLLPKAEVRV